MITSKNSTSTGKCKIALSNTYLYGFYHQIDEIKQKCKDTNESIILVVPDKFSLNAEQIFMERTGFSSIFNVWLTTLSRLVSKVVEDDENNFTLLSKNSGTMLVSKIIQDNIGKIDTYKKIVNNYGLAETMYNVINLLKSSGVKPEELKQNFDQTNFGLKVKDIYVVYSEYEKYMSSNIDSITRLQIFDKKVKNNDYIKNSHIYFANFDSFTNVQINSLANIAKYAKTFNISLCANTLQSNAQLYDNSLFQKIKSVFDDNNIIYDIVNTMLIGSNLQNFLSKNLFGIFNNNDKNAENLGKNSEKNEKKQQSNSYFCKKATLETNNVKVLECSNIASEVRYVASKIKYLVIKKGFGFDDINIAVNGLADYKLLLEQIFTEFDLPCYIDNSRTMLEHYFTRTIFKIADFIYGQKTLNNAIDIVHSPLFEIDEFKKLDFQNYCLKYNIIGEEFYSNFYNDGTEFFKNAEEIRQIVFKNINIFENNLKNSKNITQFKNCLFEYLETINAKNIINNLAEKQIDLVQKQIDLLVYDKFENVVNEADSIIGQSETNIFNFFEMLKSCLDGVNLLSVPLNCDAVFIGDASQSTYYPRKVLFVMGATQSRMPNFGSDSGMLTDAEITIFKCNNNIRPTIKELNKREKFKLFNLLTLPADKLELTFSTLINGQVEFKSEFITALQNIITTNGVPLKVEKYELEELKIFDNTDKNLASFMVGTLKNAIKISKGNTENLKLILHKQLDDILKLAEETYLDNKQRYKLTNARDKFFANNQTKVSQIERYFRCPFLHFVDYGIKPKENPKFQIKSVDVGNILHTVAEWFVKNYINNGFKFKNDIDKDVDYIFSKVISKDEFNMFSKNTYAVNNLKAESKRFCSAIKHQIESSDFKPIYAEKKFENFDIANNLKINGKVDRVDAFEFENNLNDVNNLTKNDNKKYIRVLDYKTGKDKFSYADIYYGIKLQLFVYLFAISKQLDAKPVSTGYMHVKNNFIDFFDDEFKSFKIDGITLKDDGMILRLDKNLIDDKKSNIINVEFTKDGYSKNCSKYLLSEKEISELQKYALDILNNATTEMLEGYILPKPYKKDNNIACLNCKWKSICHYQVESSGYRKITSKSKENFCLGEEK